MRGSNHARQRCFVHTHDSNVCGSVTADTGVHTGAALVHLIHCTNSVITIFGKMSKSSRKRIHLRSDFEFSSLFDSRAFPFPLPLLLPFPLGRPLHLVTLTFAFARALSFGLTFALDDSVNFPVVRASVPGFLRAQVTLDRLYHFLVVGANFF